MKAPFPRIAVFCDRFGELSETFIANEVRALREAGVDVSVEALAELWETETRSGRVRAMARLALRHPIRCAADLSARRRWRREEDVPPLRTLAPAALRAIDGRREHLHAHFAAGAALAALRIARIIGVPFSVTAHAYDIYQRPANLAEKLRAATFATSGCAYTVADLQRIAGPGHRVEEVIMGVDGAVFERRRPCPGARRVVAVGRLVEKKGFADLIEAAALLAGRGEPVDVRIAGDGPLRDALAAQARDRGVEAHVALLGAVAHDGVRDLLEDADLLAMPCVVAADGDRDSMPVVVKEALAMEVPVVGTDEVGLPEVLRPEWGRLVAPGDPAALADALSELLALSAQERAAMGRAGREHVLRACSLAGQAARMLELITATSARSAGR